MVIGQIVVGTTQRNDAVWITDEDADMILVRNEDLAELHAYLGRRIQELTPRERISETT